MRSHTVPMPRLIAAAACLATLAIADAAGSFVGSIAVGLGQLDEVGPVRTAFAARARLETEEMTVETRIHYQPGKVRDEIEMGGQRMVTIRRFDLNKIWMLMGPGMYMEVDPQQASKQAPDFQLVSREIVGPETVNGMQTTKYKSVYQSAEGRFGGFTWYTKDNIAVKGFLVHETQGEKKRVKFEFTHLERGEQADSLFEIPDGYQKLNMGGMGMPGMGGMGVPPSPPR